MAGGEGIVLEIATSLSVDGNLPETLDIISKSFAALQDQAAELSAEIAKFSQSASGMGAGFSAAADAMAPLNTALESAGRVAASTTAAIKDGFVSAATAISDTSRALPTLDSAIRSAGSTSTSVTGQMVREWDGVRSAMANASRTPAAPPQMGGGSPGFIRPPVPNMSTPSASTVSSSTPGFIRPPVPNMSLPNEPVGGPVPGFIRPAPNPLPSELEADANRVKAARESTSHSTGMLGGIGNITTEKLIVGYAGYVELHGALVQDNNLRSIMSDLTIAPESKGYDEKLEQVSKSLGNMAVGLPISKEAVVDFANSFLRVIPSNGNDPKELSNTLKMVEGALKIDTLLQARHIIAPGAGNLNAQGAPTAELVRMYARGDNSPENISKIESLLTAGLLASGKTPSEWLTQAQLMERGDITNMPPEQLIRIEAGGFQSGLQGRVGYNFTQLMQHLFHPHQTQNHESQGDFMKELLREGKPQSITHVHAFELAEQNRDKSGKEKIDPSSILRDRGIFNDSNQVKAAILEGNTVDNIILKIAKSWQEFKRNLEATEPDSNKRRQAEIQHMTEDYVAMGPGGASMVRRAYNDDVEEELRRKNASLDYSMSRGLNQLSQDAYASPYEHFETMLSRLSDVGVSFATNAVGPLDKFVVSLTGLLERMNVMINDPKNKSLVENVAMAITWTAGLTALSAIAGLIANSTIVRGVGKFAGAAEKGFEIIGGASAAELGLGAAGAIGSVIAAGAVAASAVGVGAYSAYSTGKDEGDLEAHGFAPSRQPFSVPEVGAVSMYEKDGKQYTPDEARAEIANQQISNLGESAGKAAEALDKITPEKSAPPGNSIWNWFLGTKPTTPPPAPQSDNKAVPTPPPATDQHSMRDSIKGLPQLAALDTGTMNDASEGNLTFAMPAMSGGPTSRDLANLTVSLSGQTSESVPSDITNSDTGYLSRDSEQHRVYESIMHKHLQQEVLKGERQNREAYNREHLRSENFRLAEELKKYYDQDESGETAAYNSNIIAPGTGYLTEPFYKELESAPEAPPTSGPSMLRIAPALPNAVPASPYAGPTIGDVIKPSDNEFMKRFDEISKSDAEKQDFERFVRGNGSPPAPMHHGIVSGLHHYPITSEHDWTGSHQHYAHLRTYRGPLDHHFRNHFGGESPQSGSSGSVSINHPTSIPSSAVQGAVANATAATGVNYGYLLAQAQKESSFDPGARAPGGNATGLFQFIDSTWNEMVQKYGKQYGLTPNGRTDPTQSAVAAALYAKENAKTIEKVTGHAATPGELYMGHFLGGAGAAKFFTELDKNPDAIAARMMPQAAEKNPGIFYDPKDHHSRTLAELYAAQGGGMAENARKLAEKYNGDSVISQPVPGPNATTDANSAAFGRHGYLYNDPTPSSHHIHHVNTYLDGDIVASNTVENIVRNTNTANRGLAGFDASMLATPLGGPSPARA